jgi:hypothetical protein
MANSVVRMSFLWRDDPWDLGATVVRTSEVRKRTAVSPQGYTDVFRRAIECSGRITSHPEVRQAEDRW